MVERLRMVFEVFEGMYRLIDKYLAPWLVPTLARLVFVLVLLMYFWGSAYTKLGDGLFGFINLSVGAYAQMFPRVMESVGYDASQLNIMYKLVALAGTWAEFILPLLLLVGLMTRLAAVGMIGFTFVQSFVDITGHGLSETTIGGWLDRASGSLIYDQRAFWVFLFIVMILRGAGPISIDRIFARSNDMV
ncbi:MAG: DoxX family protein [Rhodobacteraceae bacterium]|nr:DoxX family protein [Paracoccaceae bacterium]